MSNMDHSADLTEPCSGASILIKKKIGENEEKKIIEITKKLSDKKNNNKELWKIKRRTQTKQSSAFSVRNKEGNDITNPDDIKKRVSEYYNELYEYNETIEGYEEYQEELENFIKQCWISKENSKQELKASEIEDSIKNLEKDKAVGPNSISNEMIQNGGKSMKESIIRMMKIIYETEELPDEWNNAYIKKHLQGERIKERDK